MEQIVEKASEILNARDNTITQPDYLLDKACALVAGM